MNKRQCRKAEKKLMKGGARLTSGEKRSVTRARLQGDDDAARVQGGHESGRTRNSGRAQQVILGDKKGDCSDYGSTAQSCRSRRRPPRRTGSPEMDRVFLRILRRPAQQVQGACRRPGRLRR